MDTNNDQLVPYSVQTSSGQQQQLIDQRKRKRLARKQGVERQTMSVGEANVIAQRASKTVFNFYPSNNILSKIEMPPRPVSRKGPYQKPQNLLAVNEKFQINRLAQVQSHSQSKMQDKKGEALVRQLNDLKISQKLKIQLIQQKSQEILLGQNFLKTLNLEKDKIIQREQKQKIQTNPLADFITVQINDAISQSITPLPKQKIKGLKPMSVQSLTSSKDPTKSQSTKKFKQPTQAHNGFKQTKVKRTNSNVKSTGSTDKQKAAVQLQLEECGENLSQQSESTPAKSQSIQKNGNFSNLVNRIKNTQNAAYSYLSGKHSESTRLFPTLTQLQNQQILAESGSLRQYNPTHYLSLRSLQPIQEFSPYASDFHMRQLQEQYQLKAYFNDNGRLQVEKNKEQLIDNLNSLPPALAKYNNLPHLNTFASTQNFATPVLKNKRITRQNYIALQCSSPERQSTKSLKVVRLKTNKQ